MKFEVYPAQEDSIFLVEESRGIYQLLMTQKSKWVYFCNHEFCIWKKEKSRKDLAGCKRICLKSVASQDIWQSEIGTNLKSMNMYHQIFVILIW